MKPEQAEQKMSAEVSLKARPDEEGTFTAVVSVWGNVDAYGDVMVKGAFTNTLAEWKSANGQIPFIWSHNINDPDSYVGVITDARETDEGLEVDGKFDLDGPTSTKAYNLLKSGRIKEFSFGFIAREVAFATRDGEEVREVKDVELLEVSMTMIGANRATRVVAVKEAPRDSEDETTEVVFSIADLDNAIEAIKSASDTAISKLTQARDALESKNAPEVEEVAEVEEIDKQAAASDSEIDEDSTESKSTNEETAAAKAEDFELQNTLIELERMLSE